MLDFPLGTGQFVGHVGQDIVVAFGFGQDPEFRRLVQCTADPVERAQFGLKARPLLAQRLGPLRIGPDFRIFQRALDLREAFPPGIVVKDTP